MGERREQKLHISNELISGLLFLAMLCVRFVPELLIVSTFRVQQHSLAPFLPVLYRLLGCAAGIVLFAVVQMIWFEASMLLCIVAIAAAGAGIGCYILRKKLPKAAGIAANVACAVVTVLMLVLTGNGKRAEK